MPGDDETHLRAQVIRFFLYTILYWTLPRDRVVEPEEEEDEPLASDAPKSDAKRKSDDGKSGDIELGRRCAGSMPTCQPPFPSLADEQGTSALWTSETLDVRVAILDEAVCMSLRSG